MTEEPIGSPLGDAPTEAVGPTRRVNPPGVVIAPGHGPAGSNGAKDQAARERAKTGQAATAEHVAAERAATEPVAAERAAAGTDVDPSGTDGAFGIDRALATDRAPATDGALAADRTLANHGGLATNGALSNHGAESPAAVDGAADRRNARLGYAKTVAAVLLAYAALRALSMTMVLVWGNHVGIIPVHISAGSTCPVTSISPWRVTPRRWCMARTASRTQLTWRSSPSSQA